MSYFKILSWLGGAGGDTLLCSVLTSHPTMISNCDVNHFYINENGKMILSDNQTMPKNILQMSSNAADVKYDELLLEIIDLKNQKKDMILKSHLLSESLPYSISLVPSLKTMDFFFSAGLKKITRERVFRNLKYSGNFKDRDIADVEKIHKKSNLYILSKFLKEHKPDLLTDDLLSLNYNKIENVLGIEINKDGKNILKSWSEKQFELYPEELRKFRQ